jgi:predicted dehydrogenase/nucleoside-diphosphate-sugar epimerase
LVLFLMNNRNNRIRLALIGCGAIAQAHAKAIAGVAGAHCTAVYDINTERATSFRDTYCPEAQVVRRLEEVAEHADAAIVAAPNSQHAPISIALLRAGLHVLCEKPLAVSTDDARQMMSEAERYDRVLACGMLRRFYNSTNLVSETLRRNLMGSPIGFEVRESVWNWPLNRATFDRAIAGGGVLIDIGPHVFDLLNLWFGPLEVLEYRDDNRGGLEAFSYARLKCGGGVEGSVHLTRAYGTINRTRITCERGYVDFDPHDRDSITLVYTSGAEPFQTTAKLPPRDPFVKQLENFLGAVTGEAEPVAPAAVALQSVATIESCYENREPLIEVWDTESRQMLSDIPEPSYKKILVTGASGSVGSRMVEMWAAERNPDELRCMVRSYRSAARLMRFPAEVVEADLLDARAVMRAAEGCDAIVHLGVGEQAGRETQPLLDAARSLGIRRFVHMSTAAVYGMRLPTPIEDLQERTKVAKTGEPYADEKAKAERAVVRACEKGLEAIILRPHMVYGPGLRWSGELMGLLAQDKICVLEDGGWCNLIHVDDLVRAVACALSAEKGFGEPLFITDGAPLRWSEYIDAHAALLEIKPPARVPSKEILRGKLGLRGWMKESVRPLPAIVRSQEFRRFIFESPAVQATLFPAYLRLRQSRRFQPLIEKFRGGGANGSAPTDRAAFDPLWAMLQTSEARLSVERAGILIGFRPQVDFREGLRRTTYWFEQFGMMPSREQNGERLRSAEVISAAS